LSSLTYALKSSKKKPHSFEHLPNGFGSLTKTFLLGGDEDINTFSADIISMQQGMPELPTFIICTSGYYYREIPGHRLSTILLEGATASLLILDTRILGALVPFQ
jgi:hypothetical protein